MDDLVLETLTAEKESLLKKIEGLKTQRQELVNNANAVSGAIQFGEQLVAELTEKIAQKDK